MQERLKRAFLRTTYTPEARLADTIWDRIIKRERRASLLKLWIFSITGSISLVGLIPVFKMLAHDFAQSGFYEYMSLAFSNGGSIITYWRDFLSLLAESLPVISIALSLGLIFIFYLSFKYAMKQIINRQLLSA